MNFQALVVGAGLAGSEAAFQIAERGFRVRLLEMRPGKLTKAHRTGNCAELVCSNSFRGAALTNAVGLLKAELRAANSLIMRVADGAQVPAGGAFAVDRERFSLGVTEKIRNHPLIEYVEGELSEIPEALRERPVIVATGPLTSKALAKAIETMTGVGSLAFFDAISPIIFGDSIDYGKVFRQSRYDKGGGADYLNIPLSKEQYYAFVEAVDKGEKFGGHDEVEADCVDNVRPFEGCMPIEEMVSRGVDTLRFGPFKPVGLRDPNTGQRPFAVAQLRQDNQEGTLWSMVGMQTRLRHPEQQRIFRMLPGLEQAEFVRLGSVHRNTFIDSPKYLHAHLEYRTRPGLFFAGQMTGVEGYVESTAGGLVAGLNVSRILAGKQPLKFPVETAIGSLMHYISDPLREDFQPMNISFGLMPTYFEECSKYPKRPPKDEVRQQVSTRALEQLAVFCRESF